MTTTSPLPHVPLDSADFDEEIRRLVNETAPRMFAVVEEWTDDDDGTRDAEVLGWGLEFEDGRVQVVSEGRRRLVAASSAERAVAFFTRLTGGGTVRLVWVA